MLGHRWLIIGGVVGSALVVATGGAILDVSSGQPARAFETTVVDLVLPDTVMAPDRLPGQSRESTAGGNETVSPEATSHRAKAPTGRLDVGSERLAAKSSTVVGPRAVGT